MADEQAPSLYQRAKTRQETGDVKMQEVLPVSLYEGSGRERDPSFTNQIGAAVQTGLTANIADWFEERGARDDGPRIDAKTFIKADPMLSERIAELPEDYRDKMEEAQTEQQLTVMLMNAEKQLHYQRVLENGGAVSSIGAQIVAGLIDPTEIAIGLASGGLSKIVTTGRTIGRAGQVGISALSAGVSGAAVTAGLSAQNPTIDIEDIGTSFVASAVIGAPFGFLNPVDNTRIADSMGKFVRATSGKAESFEMGGYLRRSRAAESGGNDIAAATTSSAYGRYQFLQDTWVSFYKKTFGNTKESREAILAKRADGTIQDRVMETFTRENVWTLKKNELPVNDASVYLMHFLGPKDALRVLKAPGSTSINKVVRSASIKANGAVFSKAPTVEALVNWAARKMKAKPFTTGGGTTPADDFVPTSATAILAPDNERLANQIKDAEEAFTVVPEVRQPGSIGAAATEAEDVEYFGTKFLLPGMFSKMLDKSVPKDIRATVSSLISGVSRADDNTRALAAENTASRIQREWQASAYQEYNPHFASWAKERGIGLLKRELGSDPQQEFMREVTRAMRGASDVSPQARDAGAALANGYKKALLEAKRARLPGFEDIDPNVNYVPRIVNESRLMGIVKEVDMDGLKIIIKNALTKGGMEDELAERVSKAYAKGSVDRATTSGKGVGSLRGIGEDDIERLRYYLPEDDPSLVDDVIANLKNFREQRNPDGGRIDRAKFRLPMDEMAEVSINGKVYRMADVLEDDAWQLFDRYTRGLSGWIGLADRANIRSDSEWDLMMEGLRANNIKDPKWGIHEERLNQMKDLILGRPISTESGTFRRTVQATGKANFITTMGQAGMASFAEMGNIVAYAGMKNMMMHLPAFRNFWRQAKDGNLDKELTEELQAQFGVGMRLALGRGRAGFDDWGDPIEQKIFDTADRILDPFQRTVSYVGLLGPMNDFLQVLATKSFMQKFANVATGRKKFTEGEILRLRDAGFEDGVLQRALESIKQHGTMDGKRIVGLGLDKWDQSIAADFKDSIDRMVYRAVQENDIGSSAWWMHTTLGKMATQFRSFIMNALVKQTMYMARYRRDPQVWAAFAFTTFFGGLSYVGRNYLNSIGREDAEEYREKRYGSLDALAKGAFNSTGYASIIPSAIDTGLFAAGQDNLFANGRTTGLASDFITGNPTVRTGQAAMAVSSLPLRLPQEDYSFSQSDMRQIQAITPLGNVTGIRNMFALLNEELPERSQEDEYWQ
ncbi:MAG: hypothetical protein EAY76_00195 [Alphaproteobacteria bacterium]|nr:MAG: hypothetical protein EAY76_00195 [Alphaproteobacteria bacterium]